jgi:hypothetical protein
MKSTILRISLALLFCLGMFVTANPAALGQRDRGNRERCQKECQEKYKERMRDCKGMRGKDKRGCKERATKERNECKDRCR